MAVNFCILIAMHRLLSHFPLLMCYWYAFCILLTLSSAYVPRKGKASVTRWNLFHETWYETRETCFPTLAVTSFSCHAHQITQGAEKSLLVALLCESVYYRRTVCLIYLQIFHYLWVSSWICFKIEIRRINRDLKSFQSYVCYCKIFEI